eukprot:CAMPEP_0202807464 /NCGR_PEP_ID=MMETSP1389-20130828/179_1 /ASSEMBLY_ACC=CAM_ASM_000865 /TAXON_ID=302021 /ORGANISM="Rhodomonas sp., Strain CCMP768" /LENGTH=107 /DNA_ID=CAMNT_0049477495 /DNA_START=59 /DNA_END=380 /DNA_ORIENTATION=+
MTRGNQRDIDRARAQARAQKNGAGKNEDGLTPTQRKERDAAALAEKIKKKEAAKAAAGVDTENPSVANIYVGEASVAPSRVGKVRARMIGVKWRECKLTVAIIIPRR